MPRKRSKVVEEPILETKQKVTETIEEVSEPVIEKVEAEVITTGTVNTNMLNIRSGPSKDFVPRFGSAKITLGQSCWLCNEGVYTVIRLMRGANNGPSYFLKGEKGLC